MSRKNAPAPHRLIVQPDDGAEPVLGLLAEAGRMLRIVQFTWMTRGSSRRSSTPTGAVSPSGCC
jgi:hypothetical protein